MRLTFELGPLNVDFSVTVGAQAAEYAGTTGSTAVAGPSEVPWEDPGSLHQFEPEDVRRVGFR